nr:unnamed protein product [Callosobruchus analis]
MSITNSWLEYRQDAKLRNIPKKENLDLLSFTFSIAESLAKCDRDVISRKGGRPSSADCTPQPFKKKLKIDVRPQTDPICCCWSLACYGFKTPEMQKRVMSISFSGEMRKMQRTSLYDVSKQLF